VCRRNDRYELIDGFKRLGAVRRLVPVIAGIKQPHYRRF
jgi:hypothetical protein